MTLKQSLESKGFRVTQWDGSGVRWRFVDATLEVGDYLITKDDIPLPKLMIHKKDFEDIESMLAGSKEI